jgi:hypothetical protein
MKRDLSLFLCLLATWGCAARIAQMSAKQRSERLAAERGNLTEVTDPVSRTRSYITISEILLSFASEAIRDGAIGDVKPLMDQYIMAVEGGRDAIIDSGRDAERRPDGYKDLEIAMREQLRLLEDMSRKLSLDDRKPIEGAIAAATSVRDEMLERLFPSRATASGVN